MPSKRVIYRFANGDREMREPPSIPEIGDRFKRLGKEWVVTALREQGDITVVTLHRTSPERGQAELEQALRAPRRSPSGAPVRPVLWR